MAGLLTVAPPGSMVIDLGKRKKKADLTPDLHTVASWNASKDGLQHPKGGDGRWVDRAGLIDAVRSIAGVSHWSQMQSAHTAKTGVHDWSDEELASAAGHAEVFARKLASEIEARKTAREAPVSNREAELKVLQEKGFAAFSSFDLERAKTLGLTPPDAAPSAKPLRAAKVKAPTKAIPAELQSRIDAARGRPMSSDRRHFEQEFAKLTVAQLEEIARQGENWKDLPLPAGKKESKIRDTIERITGRLSTEAVTHQSSNRGRDYDEEYHRRLKEADLAGDREGYAALVAGYGVGGTGPGLPPEKAPPKQDFGVGKPLRARKAKPMEGNDMGSISGLSPSSFGAEDARMTAIASIVANPQAGDADRLRGWLKSLKLPELRAAADKHGIKLVGRTKAEKIDNFIGSTVQNKLNSRAIRSLGDDVPDASKDLVTKIPTKVETPAEALTRRIDALDKKIRMERSESALLSMRDKRNRLEIERAGLTGTAPKLVDNTPARPSRQPTHLNTSARTQGDGQFYGNHYHPDGRVGEAIQDMTDEQRAINVNGERLDDALADVIIMGHKGDVGVTNRQIEAWRDISAHVRPIDADAASKIDRAVARLKPPEGRVVPDDVFMDAPEPLKVLHSRLANIPETGMGGGELARLNQTMQDWSAGKVRALQLEEKLRVLLGLRHESQEGHWEINKAVTEAMKQLDAMQSALRAQQAQIRARGA